MSDRIKVLYVDDEPINLKLFELNFNSTFGVVTASSGFEGIEVLEKDSSITVVVSDMRMPRMDGIEFIAKAKSMFPHIYFFILTGFDITEEIAEALDSNLINKYFRKPLNFREIEKSILGLFD